MRLPISASSGGEAIGRGIFGERMTCWSLGDTTWSIACRALRPQARAGALELKPHVLGLHDRQAPRAGGASTRGRRTSVKLVELAMADLVLKAPALVHDLYE